MLLPILRALEFYICKWEPLVMYTLDIIYYILSVLYIYQIKTFRAKAEPNIKSDNKDN